MTLRGAHLRRQASYAALSENLWKATLRFVSKAERHYQVHVIHLVPSVFGPGGIFGGAERYALELARHMAENAPTTLLSFGPSDRSEQLGGLKLRVMGKPHLVRNQAHNPFSRKLFRELRGGTILHCHQTHVLASSLAALFARVTGRKVYTTDLGGGGWDLSAFVRTDGWFHGHLHISRYSKEIAGHASSPSAYVIGGGVDTERFSPEAAVAKETTILYVGRILPHKGIIDLIDAVEPDWPLKVIGAASDAAYLETLKNRARGKQVEFLHNCRDADLIDEYRKASCVVLPSVYRSTNGTETKIPELLGQTLLEGMACGLPALGTAVASLPEVIQDGCTGFIVPPNQPAALKEKLAWLRQNPEEARRMGERGRARVLAEFTWDQVVERCLKIYHL